MEFASKALRPHGDLGHAHQARRGQEDALHDDALHPQRLARVWLSQHTYLKVLFKRRFGMTMGTFRKSGMV